MLLDAKLLYNLINLNQYRYRTIGLWR